MSEQREFGSVSELVRFYLESCRPFPFEDDHKFLILKEPVFRG